MSKIIEKKTISKTEQVSMSVPIIPISECMEKLSILGVQFGLRAEKVRGAAGKEYMKSLADIIINSCFYMDKLAKIEAETGGKP